MKIFKIIIPVFLAVFTFSSFSAELDFDEIFQINENKALPLRNYAVFAPVSFSLYAIGLYVEGSETDNMKLKNTDKPMAIQLMSLYRWLKMKKLMGELRRGFSYGMDHDKAYLASIQVKIDYFIDLLMSTGKRNLGKYKRVTFFYEPGIGTRVSYEGKILGTVPGLDFKKALFGIWLNNNCANDELRNKIVKLRKKTEEKIEQ